jgi:S-adenosylmethionine:tRNA ribosyltransferase-isomerase
MRLAGSYTPNLVKTELFDYELREELIAQRPTEARDGARMLVLGHDGTEHTFVRELAERIPEGSLVVLNETRVRRARLACRRPAVAGGGGGRAELLLLGPLPDGSWRALGRANKPLRVGDGLEATGLDIAILEREADGTLRVSLTESGAEAAVGAAPSETVESLLERYGEMPIPPYMRRDADFADVDRYQTVFARKLGSVAAPTAGLHVTGEALARLEARGVRLGRLLLHVGVGTFRPVSADDLDEHDMHAEWIEVDESLCAAVAEARARGGRVIAIGTTAVRALESAADPDRPGFLRPYRGETRLLIQPGYGFRVTDGLLTNFHMPKSTLLALVSAFAGRERVLSAYAAAQAAGYRFLSYGDAMWIPERLS